MKLKFLGNGSGFTASHNNAYFVHDNDLVLIDCSLVHFDKFMSMNLKKYDNIYILITHMHADHVSGLGLLLQYLYYVLGKKGIVVFPRELLSDINMYMKISGVSMNICEIKCAQSDDIDWLNGVIPVTHAPELEGKCFGYLLTVGKTKCLYTGDTNSLDIIEAHIHDVDEVYVDMSYFYGGVHLKFDDVVEKLMEYSMEASIYLMHLDNTITLSSDLEQLDTDISIAKVVPPTYYNSEEIRAIKQIVAFNKNELIDLILSFAKNASDSKEQVRFERLLKKAIDDETIETIVPDFSTKVVKGYYVDLDYSLTTCDDFHFTYDNEGHELYVDSWTYVWG